MASFTNQATLFYNNNTVNSNIVTGELQEVLSVSKAAMTNNYTANDIVTFIVTLVNTGTTAFSNLTLTDNLGGYTYDTATVYPLTYIQDSLRYYTNGTEQPTPTTISTPPLEVSGISVPAGGNATILYQAQVSTFAPPLQGGQITNTVSVTGNGIVTPLTAVATLTAEPQPDLAINKALSPAVITENSTLTYTLTIQNFGNTPATTADAIVVTDTFDPILSSLSVTFNGTAWAPTTNYTYDTQSGAFSTVAGQITVPAATFTQNADGSYAVTPGISTLVITGTV